MILHYILSLFSVCSSPKDSCIETVKIFRTYKDFASKKSNDNLCLDNKKNKVRINYNFITLKKGNSKNTYSNSQLWGYQNANEIFRLYDPGTSWGDYGYVRVLENDQSGLVIYSKKERYYSSFGTREHFFYSKDLESTIKKLSFENLKADYQNPDFIQQISLMDNLTEKDNDGNYKIYKIYRRYYN
jgi:hypothetical protein